MSYLCESQDQLLDPRRSPDRSVDFEMNSSVVTNIGYSHIADTPADNEN